MCGIAGVCRDRGAAVDPNRLGDMAHALRHRGPDESATWVGPGVGFAHTRLSIIDLSASHQPMHAVDGSWSLVFNGEIFNYEELRRDLDYPFSTTGDTETLLAGLVVHGIAFVHRLRGQFAFAAFERDAGRLHLVRDRLGILPLYYRGDDEGGLVFGSEIKAILAYDTERKPQVDSDSLDAYLTSRSVPAPYTLFAGVSKLPAGSRVEFIPGEEVRVERYWEPPVVGPWSAGHAATVDLVDAGIRDAVRAALVADVPVGSYLSGGVDSSLIVAVMAELRNGAPIDTFAAGFGDPRNDELPWARRVSDLFGTRHHEVVVSPDDFLSLWPSLTWQRDAPMSEPADMAVFRLAELARQHVRVVLSGEGGDELFGGYPKYRFAPLMTGARVVPERVRTAIGGSIERRLPDRLARPRIMLRALSAGSPVDQLSTWFAPFTSAERRELLGGDSQARRVRQVPDGAGSVDRMLRYDLESWLPDNLLERGDRMSMAASLELRPPLLDHQLVELAFRLPASLKVRRGVTKWLLKEVARRYLPAAVVDRRKVGFRVPLDDWFRHGLREAAWDRLTGPSSFVGSTMDRTAVRRLLERHDSGRHNEESRLWTLLSLEVWHDVCIRGNATDG